MLRPEHQILGVDIAGQVKAAGSGITRFAPGDEAYANLSTRNINLVRSLGADHVIDYTTTDFAPSVRRHDLILDTVGRIHRLRPGTAAERDSFPREQVA